MGTTFAKNGPLHIFSHAMVGGVSSVLQGGKFGHGFFSAGFVKAVTPSIEGLDGWVGSDGRSYEQAFAAAIVGGTVSVATGGKFANGAVTAAMGNLFNQQGGEAAQKDGAARSVQAFKNMIKNMNEATDLREWLYSIDDVDQLNLLAGALGMDEYVGSLNNPTHQKYFKFRVDADIISLNGLKMQSAEVFQFGKGVTEEIIDAALMKAVRAVPLDSYTAGKNRVLDYYERYEDLNTLYDVYGVVKE